MRKSRRSRMYASKKRKLYGGGSGISVGAEQYGVYGPGNPDGARMDFESMARNAGDSMIAYPSEIFPKDLVGQKGGAMNTNDVSGNEVTKMLDAMKGGRKRTAKGRKTARKVARKTARKTVRSGGGLSPALKSWNKAVMKVYREMKAKDKNTKLRDAMKEAKRRKDKGQL